MYRLNNSTVNDKCPRAQLVSCYAQRSKYPLRDMRGGECVYGVSCVATTMKLNLFISYIVRNSSYPKGNFGGNQLLDGSMSLSPLYPDQAATICTSVPHNASFHQVFTWLHHVRAKFTIFRVSTKLLFSLISTRARVSLHKLYTRSEDPVHMQ